jgi:hypothetical protein
VLFKVYMMFLGNRKRYFFYIILLLCGLPLSGQNISEGNSDNFLLRADTVYIDTVINGRDVVVRNITIFDTVFLMSSQSLRPFKFKQEDLSLYSSKLESPNFTSKQFDNIELEAGLIYGFGLPSNPFVSNAKPYSSIEKIEFLEGYVHGAMYFNKWYLKTGLNLSINKNTFSFSKNNSIVDSTDFYSFSFDSLRIDTIYFLDITVLPDTAYIRIIKKANFVVNDTIYKNKTTSFRKEVINKQFRLGIPLLAGRVFRFNKFDLAIESGIYLNLFVKAKGNTMDYHNNTRKLKDSYLYRYSTDFALRAQFRYKLNNLRYLSITPILRYNLLSHYSDPDILQSKILSFRFAIGYNFY